MSVVVRMNKRYVDDINFAVQATPPGMRYKNGHTYVDESSVTEDGRVSSDERTMALIKQVGKDIHPSIQLEVDYPSKRQDGKLPILDLKVWVESREKKTEGQVGKVSVIMYSTPSAWPLKVARSGFSVTIPLNFEQLAYHSEQPNKKSIVAADLEKNESFK